MPPIVHLTSSVYLFARIDGSLHLGLIEHPRVGGLLIAGGHVETTVEMPSDAALRETAEETGFHARLVPPPHLALPLGYPHPAVASPWWIPRIPVNADGHASEPHVHEDHQYVAEADLACPRTPAEHPFHWVLAVDLPRLPLPTGTRIAAEHLFALLDVRPDLLTAGVKRL
ncbi:NUDIX domain-containing protein (plasmid) [Kitasatospora sp. NBC_00374]|uniref:NUDIX domain-containing protein n=1 Tax=Kitasatospora sp. NBC_00374 TaxID=2975964 RepID=UPI002F916DC8